MGCDLHRNQLCGSLSLFPLCISHWSFVFKIDSDFQGIFIHIRVHTIYIFWVNLDIMVTIYIYFRTIMIQEIV